MTQSSSGIFHDMRKGVQTGALIMMAQTPIVTSFNRVSVVCCRYNLTMQESIRQIFRGTIDNAPKPSIKHFLKGVSGHLAKEFARIVFRGPAFVLKPRVDHYFKDSSFGKMKSDLLFATALSGTEIFIHPADTLRTMWQANEKISFRKKGIISHLYKGALASGARQFGIWIGFPFSERVWSKVIEDKTRLDSHSISGILIKSLPQSIQVTASIWIFERLKNELQYRPILNNEGKKNSYAKTFEEILQRQGWRGLIRGFMPKVWSGTVVVIGANYLIEQGRT